MSQEKVAKYKEQKANRKEIMKKEKRAKLLRNIIAYAVGVVLIGWIGYSAVDLYLDNRPRPTAEVDYTAVDEYTAQFQDQEETTETTDTTDTTETTETTDTTETTETE